MYHERGPLTTTEWPCLPAAAYPIGEDAVLGSDRAYGAGKFAAEELLREAGRGTYKRVLESGVRLWEYQPSMLHTKTTLVDEDLCVVGSINLEPLSMNLLDEGSLVFFSPEIARELSRDFEADLAYAQEITVDTIPAPALQPERRLFRRIATRVIRGLRPRQREIAPEATGDTG